MWLGQNRISGLLWMCWISHNMEENSEARLAKRVKFDELEDTLVYFATSIIRNNTEEEILWDLAKNCISRLNFVDCVIYKIDYRRRVLVQKAAYGPKNPRRYEIFEPIQIELGKGITGTVGLSGKAEIINNTSEDSRYIVDDEVRLSEIAVPILLNEKVWGVIDCEHPTPNYFTHRDLRILTSIAAICAVKLAKIGTDKELAQRQVALFEVEKELLDLRLKSLRGQMHPHFLFNALNAIQYFITSERKREALRYHTLFSKLIRHYIFHLDKENIFLEEEIRMINWYLSLQLLRYHDRFSYTINADESIYHLSIPALILQLVVEELIENMVMSNSGLGDLALSFNFQENILEFRAVLKLPAVSSFKRQSNASYRTGFLTWSEYVDALNRLKNTNILKHSEAISDNDGETVGTAIKLLIPILA